MHRATGRTQKLASKQCLLFTCDAACVCVFKGILKLWSVELFISLHFKQTYLGLFSYDNIKSVAVKLLKEKPQLVKLREKSTIHEGKPT